jgi:alpha/beta superfamily hydrolase
MAYGSSAAKEMYLSNFAKRFEEAGFVVLVFDYRYFGDSKGESRGRLMPHKQHEDYKSAITWVSQRPVDDPDQIGV